jgi:hypothetical protein
MTAQPRGKRHLIKDSDSGVWVLGAARICASCPCSRTVSASAGDEQVEHGSAQAQAARLPRKPPITVVRRLPPQRALEWVRKNYGARGVHLERPTRDGAEIHLAGQLKDLGLAFPREAWLAVGQVKVVAVPKGSWRRFFEYVVLERETGVSRSGAAHSAVEVRFRLAG